MHARLLACFFRHGGCNSPTPTRPSCGSVGRVLARLANGLPHRFAHGSPVRAENARAVEELPRPSTSSLAVLPRASAWTTLLLSSSCQLPLSVPPPSEALYSPVEGFSSLTPTFQGCQNKPRPAGPSSETTRRGEGPLATGCHFFISFRCCFWTSVSSFSRASCSSVLRAFS
jgi:hypothetical protein